MRMHLVGSGSLRQTKMPGQPGRIICWFRNLLLGRPLESAPWLRYVRTLSPRSPPLPNLPHGPAHKLAGNYYCMRDLRRAVTQPTLAKTQNQLPTAEEISSEEVHFPQITTPPTPGRWTKT